MSAIAKIIQMKIHTWNFIFPLLSFYLIQVSINTPVLLLGGGWQLFLSSGFTWLKQVSKFHKQATDFLSIRILCCHLKPNNSLP